MIDYNADLDVKYLNDLYGDDVSIAKIMFESFLDEIIPIWEEIKDKIFRKEYATVGQLVHQIKPTFSMVGLTSLHPRLQDFEKYIKENREENGISKHYEELSVNVYHAKAVISNELKRLEDID